MSNGVYIIQEPHSDHDPTGRYRVVHAEEWAAYVNGASPVLAIAGSFATLAEAETRRDVMNRLPR